MPVRRAASVLTEEVTEREKRDREREKEGGKAPTTEFVALSSWHVSLHCCDWCHQSQHCVG